MTDDATAFLRRPSRDQELDAEITRLSELSSLKSWNDFVEALTVPSDLLPALMSNRAELVKLVKAHALDAAEHRVYLELIAGLIKTNAALRDHAAQVAQLVENWTAHFTGLHATARRVSAFANFKHLTTWEGTP